MRSTAREINWVTGTIIAISGRLIVYALVVLLLYQGVVKGYEFGHDIFYDTSADAEPGRDQVVRIKEGATVRGVARQLKNNDLIVNEYSFIIQSIFFDYQVNPGEYTVNSSMTSKEILQMMDANKAEEED